MAALMALFNRFGRKKVNLFILLLVLAIRRLDIGWSQIWIAADRVQQGIAPLIVWMKEKQKSNGAIWLVVVLVPVLLWAWLRSWVLPSVGYVLDAVLLLWLLGAESEFRYLSGLIQRVRMHDTEQLEVQARQHFALEKSASDDNYLDRLVHRILLKSAEGTFAVLFWFFLAGTWGCLLYGLNFALAKSLTRGNVAEQLHKLLVWLPDRLLLVALAFAGSFRGATDAGARYWWQLDSWVLFKAAIPDGLDLPRNMPSDFFEIAKVKLIALEGLLNRCLALWLIVGVLWWALLK